MTSLPRYLYHGTRAQHQARILERDLVPRGQSGVSQWQHTAESRSDAVYLTTTYPLHFAANAQGEGDLLIIEVDTALLDQALLIADEDALAHALDEPVTRGMSLLEKTIYYRGRSHHYSAAQSLALLGTCAYRGPVPRTALRRTARIRIEDIGTLIIGGFDATVSPMNYMLFGDDYQKSVGWLFGDTDTCAINPRMPAVPIIVTELPAP